MDEAQSMLYDAVVDACALYVQSIGDETLSLRLRLDAAAFIIERVLGKVGVQEQSHSGTVIIVDDIPAQNGVG